MIHKLTGLPAGLHGLRVDGEWVPEEHEAALRALIAEARTGHGDVRLLYEFASGFEGFDGRDAWHEMRSAWRLLRESERCAVVSPDASVRGDAKVAGALVPARVRAFVPAERTEAADWLQAEPHETLSVRILAEVGTLLVQPMEAISQEDLEHLREVTERWLAANRRLRALVVHAYRFPSWEDLRAALHRWELVRERSSELDRVAVAVGGPAAGFIAALGELFPDAEVRRFEPHALADAIEWAAVPTGLPSGGAPRRHSRVETTSRSS